MGTWVYVPLSWLFLGLPKLEPQTYQPKMTDLLTHISYPCNSDIRSHMLFRDPCFNKSRETLASFLPNIMWTKAKTTVFKIRYCQVYPCLEKLGISIYVKPECCWPTLIGMLSECYILSEVWMTMAFVLKSGSLLKREGDSASVWILLLLCAVSRFRVDSFGSN
jgi:hypothetical protein